MNDLIITIIATALLSSVLTLVLAAVYFKKVAQPKMQRYINDTLLPAFREQVKEGGKDAGKDMLPAFRKSVSDGFQDAIKEAPADLIDALRDAPGDILEETTKTVSKTIESGLDMLLGKS